jgi:hypothetical protein
LFPEPEPQPGRINNESARNEKEILTKKPRIVIACFI